MYTQSDGMGREEGGGFRMGNTSFLFLVKEYLCFFWSPGSTVRNCIPQASLQIYIEANESEQKGYVQLHNKVPERKSLAFHCFLSHQDQKWRK